jgi:hypothetical protein
MIGRKRNQSRKEIHRRRERERARKNKRGKVLDPNQRIKQRVEEAAQIEHEVRLSRVECSNVQAQKCCV